MTKRERKIETERGAGIDTNRHRETKADTQRETNTDAGPDTERWTYKLSGMQINILNVDKKDCLLNHLQENKPRSLSTSAKLSNIFSSPFAKVG